MRSLSIPQASCLKGEITLLGDKSIAHRCIIASAITQGKTTIENFPTNKDCFYTIAAFKKLGIKIKQAQLKTPNKCPVITVFGKGLYGLKKPKVPIFVGDSGTTLRLLLGVLAGQNFKVELIAGKSLSRRPMLRVTQPLRMMGAEINAKTRKTPACRQAGHGAQREEYPPLTIRGGSLRPISYTLPVASAQVKSAILLAGLYVPGISRLIEPVSTRDHSERILKLFKAEIQVKQNTIVIKGGRELVTPKRIYIPGDISSASFFMVCAAILPNSEILIKNVSLNPSRIGVIRVLKRMGASIKVTRFSRRRTRLQRAPGSAEGGPYSGHQVPPKADPTAGTSGEPMGDMVVKSSKLRGILVKGEEIPSLIDELPILMVAACFAKGRTIFAGVGELRVKETDRIRSMSENLKKMGANIEVLKVGKSENIIIKGIKDLYGNKVRSFGDHRTAMSMVVAGLRAKGKTYIDDISCIDKSFPDFTRLLKNLIP